MVLLSHVPDNLSFVFCNSLSFSCESHYFHIFEVFLRGFQPMANEGLPVIGSYHLLQGFQVCNLLQLQWWSWWHLGNRTPGEPLCEVSFYRVFWLYHEQKTSSRTVWSDGHSTCILHKSWKQKKGKDRKENKHLSSPFRFTSQLYKISYPPRHGFLSWIERTRFHGDRHLYFSRFLSFHCNTGLNKKNVFICKHILFLFFVFPTNDTWEKAVKYLEFRQPFIIRKSHWGD